MKHSKLLALATMVAALVAVVVVQGSSARTTADFACYSLDQVDPGAWSPSYTDVFSSWDSYATGYWAPYAETSTPTNTMAGGYYLDCSKPAGSTATGMYVLGDGSSADPSYYVVNGTPLPGVYQVVTASS